MKIYDDFLIPDYVKEENWPKIGEIFVALDPQLRCGTGTFVVATQGDGTCIGDTVQLGLFWKKEDAILFDLDKKCGDEE